MLVELGRNTLVEHLGMQLTELGPDFLTATMPVDHRTCQSLRLLHGGASVALAETLGSIAANAALSDRSSVCVGQEINANHLRAAREGSVVTGTARPFHIGATSHVWGIEIVGERGQLVCVSRITLAVIKARPPRPGAA
jgi:1,4-dihydroxy-2-naphthoyl-CoA hydrolase